MKKIKIYKRALALLTASTISIFSGCSDKNIKSNENACMHLTVYFEDKTVTFKECEGYDILTYNKDGMFKYRISKNGEKIVYEGWTNNFHYCEVNHKYDNLIDELAKEKVLSKKLNN